MEYTGTFKTIGITTKNDGSADYQVGITTTIVGQPYAGFNNGDTTVINVPDIMNKTGEQILTIVQAGVDSFVSQKYPNT